MGSVDVNRTYNGSGFIGNITNGADKEIMNEVFGGVRFIVYTLLLCISLFLNTLSLLAMWRIRIKRTVYHTFLLNLAITDIFGSILLWMYYNSPHIFPRFLVTSLSACLFVVAILAGPFVMALSACVLSLLSLALNQYIAICYPLVSATTITKRKAYIVIALIWLFSAIIAMVPSLIVIATPNCRLWYRAVGSKALETCAYVLAVLVIVIVGLYGRIYHKIIRYKHRQPQMQCRNPRGAQEQEHNYKAFITTLLLTGTLIVFWLPYTVVHLLSAHINPEEMPLFLIYMKLYFIDFLPVLNYITDPIIYGIRIPEIRDGYRRLMMLFVPCRMCMKRTGTSGQQAGGTLMIRLSNMDTSTV